MQCLRDLTLRTLVAEFQGKANLAFPQATAIGDPIQFTENYALVGLQLSSSLTIYGSNKGGILLVIGKQPKNVTISNSLQTPITHITGPNSITGTPNVPIPATKVTSLSFGQYGIRINAGTPLRFYAFADATADNDLFAICSLQLVPFVA